MARIVYLLTNNVKSICGLEVFIMRKAIAALGLLLLLLVSSNVQAVPISGEIYFFGSATVTGPNTVGDYDLANATGISFNGAIVESAFGDFADAGLGFGCIGGGRG